MKELELVDKQIATTLRELGFDWDVDWVYNARVKDSIKYRAGEILSGDEELYAPTQALVCKWLRDVYKIRINPQHSDSTGYIKCIGWRWNYDNKVGKWEKLFIIHDMNTYEQAEKAGIIETLKLIKANNDK